MREGGVLSLLVAAGLSSAPTLVTSYAEGDRGRWVYWTDHASNTIHRASLPRALGGGRQRVEQVLQRPNMPWEIEVDDRGRRIYWHEHGSLWTAGLGGENPDTVIDRAQGGVLRSFDLLTLDQRRQRLFFSSKHAVAGQPYHLHAMELADPERPVSELHRFGPVPPRGLAVDPRRREIYWVNFHQPVADKAGFSHLRVYKTGYSGGEPTAVFETQLPGGNIIGMDFDPRRKRLYWGRNSGGGGRVIEALDLRGRQPALSVLAGHPEANYPGECVADPRLFRGRIYWADLNSNAVYAVDRDGECAGNVTPVPDGDPHPTGIDLYRKRIVRGALFRGWRCRPIVDPLP